MSIRLRMAGVGGLVLAGAVLQPVVFGGDGPTGGGAVFRSSKAMGCGPECGGDGGGRLSGWLERKRAEFRDGVTGYPEEFVRPPVGMATHGILAQQRMQAQSSRTTLYRYDFVRGSVELNAAGRARLARMVRQLQRTPGVLSIESSEGGLELDEARRASVMAELTKLQCELPADWVRVIGGPEHSLDSESALLIQANRLQQTKTQGSGVGSGAGSGVSGGVQQSAGLVQ